MNASLRPRSSDDDDWDDQPPAPSSPSLNQGAIIGGSIAGALVLLALVALLIWFLRRRNRRRTHARRRSSLVLLTDPVPEVIGSPTTAKEPIHPKSTDASHDTVISPFNGGVAAFAALHHSDTKRPPRPLSHGTEDEESASAASSSALAQENAALRRELEDMRGQMESVASSSVAGHVSHATPDSDIGPVKQANVVDLPPPKYTFSVANQ